MKPIIAVLLFAATMPAFGATREETLRVLDGVRATWKDPARLEVWINDHRGSADDPTANVIALGEVERLVVVTPEDAHVLAFRVDAYGDIRPFPRDAADLEVKANTENVIPPREVSAVRRLPTGTEDIYVFASKTPFAVDAFVSDLNSSASNEADPGPAVAARIANRLNLLPPGTIVAAKALLTIEPRPGLTRGASDEPDYTADDIADYFSGSDVPSRGARARRFNGLIEFQTGKALLSARSLANLGSWVDALTTKSGMTGVSLALEGHTDYRGTDVKNLQLSRERANAVREFLVQRGVPGSRLAAEGYGSEHPLREGTSAEALQANRRVDFRIVRMN